MKGHKTIKPGMRFEDGDVYTSLAFIKPVPIAHGLIGEIMRKPISKDFKYYRPLKKSKAKVNGHCWRVAIDDGFVAYQYEIDIPGNNSILSVANLFARSIGSRLASQSGRRVHVVGVK